MRKFCSIVYSFAISRDSVKLLNPLANEYLTLFRELCVTEKNKDTLISIKMHFMVHYQTLFEQYGPLVYFSTKRFEMRHQDIKQFAKNTKNYINIAYSTANKLAKAQVTSDLCPVVNEKNNDVLRKNFDNYCGPEDFTGLSLPSNLNHETIDQLSSISYHKLELKIGHIFFIKKDGETFLGRIHHLFRNQTNGEQFVIAQRFNRSLIRKQFKYSEKREIRDLLNETGLNYRYFSYEIIETPMKLSLALNDIRYPKPLPFFNKNGKLFVRKVFDFS